MQHLQNSSICIYTHINSDSLTAVEQHRYGHLSFNILWKHRYGHLSFDILWQDHIISINGMMSVLCINISNIKVLAISIFQQFYCELCNVSCLIKSFIVNYSMYHVWCNRLIFTKIVFIF